MAIKTKRKYSKNKYPKNKYSKRKYSKNKYPKRKYSKRKYSKNKYPKNNYYIKAGMRASPAEGDTSSKRKTPEEDNEDAILIKIVDEHPQRDWQAITGKFNQMMGTIRSGYNRSMESVKQRYRDLKQSLPSLPKRRRNKQDEEFPGLDEEMPSELPLGTNTRWLEQSPDISERETARLLSRQTLSESQGFPEVEIPRKVPRRTNTRWLEQPPDISERETARLLSRTTPRESAAMLIPEDESDWSSPPTHSFIPRNEKYNSLPGPAPMKPKGQTSYTDREEKAMEEWKAAHLKFLNGNFSITYPDGGTFIYENKTDPPEGAEERRGSGGKRGGDNGNGSIIKLALKRIEANKYPTLPLSRMIRYMQHETEYVRDKGAISRKISDWLETIPHDQSKLYRLKEYMESAKSVI